ncbi:uncharacterized protein TRAVEDRAFT_36045 [Trametes versicolor FP-101664 SS1]|uniref:uncharacterized protein n=1 Tax=Trametes versicolor (strain FP-101664) TaxID=717944 RepID=UPI00046218EE|nr:uncharacterized protein TRAVEDRAFT_36045 [Trametes versicolor FP-101664 SS1]EIW60350.1 hypothetical protein TRAVEDRAFT_36045 [Trametes versicolor FP-101664 SS1]
MPLQIDKLSARILSDGKELEIFSANYDDEITATGWIASEVSKEFRVQWTDHTGKQSMTVDIQVDGRLAQQLAHHPCNTESMCMGIYETEASICPFKFSELMLTDDDALMNTKNTSDKLGSIELVFTRCEGFIAATKPFEPTGLVEIGPIHEKSKKAGVHAVTLGVPQAMQRIEYRKAFGAEPEPCARIVFRYRPLDLLRANGIAPPAPKPDHPPKRGAEVQDPEDGAGPRDPKRRRQEPGVKTEALSDDEDDEEDKNLKEQLALLQDRLEKRRAKKAKEVVKREISPIHVPIAADDEVIDLTSSP